MKSKQLIIIRGLPGSGKSTLAKKLIGKTGVIHSTDNYFIKDGIYTFDYEKLSEYHDRNLEAAIKSIEEGISPIVIDNTNIHALLALPYVIEGKYYKYDIIVVETQTPWRFNIEELLKRNIHNIPRESLEQMIRNYEPIEVFKEKLEIR